MPVAVGVDLGSTHCNVGVWHQGRPEVIANHHGLRATPTMVAFTDSEVLVGEAALSQMPKNVANTVTGFKWMVGQKHAQLEPHIKAMLGESRVVWGGSEHLLEKPMCEGHFHRWKYSCYAVLRSLTCFIIIGDSQPPMST